MGAENYWPVGPSAGDFNADGWTIFRRFIHELPLSVWHQFTPAQ